MAGEKAAFSFSMADYNPEDFHKLALFTDPETTPIFSALGAGYAVTQPKHEWLTASLPTAAANAVVEGATISATDPDVPARLYNNVQQMDRSYFITDIQQRAAELSGTNFTIGEIMRRATIALKKDANKAVIEQDTRVDGASGTAGKFGGLPYWMNTSNYSSANVIDASSATLSEKKHFLKALQAAYDDHDPDGKYWVFCNSNKKLAIDQFTGTAVNNRNQVKSAELDVDVEFYHSSFGDVAVVMDRQMSDTDIYVLDPEYIKKSFFIPITNKSVTDDSNFTKHRYEKLVTCAFTMEMRDPKCHARISSLAAG